MNQLLVVILLVTIFMVACESNRKNAPETISQGELLFKRYCKACHGKDGTLQINGAFDLSTSQLNQLEIINVVSNGRNDMIGYKKILTEQEMISIANFVLNLR